MTKFLENSSQGNNKWYIYMVSFFFMLGGNVIGSIPLIVAMFYFNSDMNFESASIEGRPTLTLALMLLTFIATLGMLLIAIKYLHKKRLNDVLTGRPSFDWSRMFYGIKIWFAVMAVSSVISVIISPEDVELIFDLGKFVPLFFVVILMVPIQAATEEVIFRAYYMQGMTMISRNRWLPLLVTSIIFGLLHIGNPEVEEFGVAIMMPQYISMGLFFGIMTLMDDGSELAIGMHAINNVFLALFFTHDSSALKTDAVFRIKEVNPEYEMIFMLIQFTIVLFILSRKYKWKDWSRLYAKVIMPKEPEAIEEL
ncbi:CPBP family intramembrane glutamic endopeptidase [Aureibacter tunicatorum]|uniref:CAAX prenyl protease 2/Lysostaphin resistance protein A-like domain-containing protein n=1 Tax=Aureibacter tunicatorum TaxID=866807 RepID=A0AAE4BP49_9BACT|nr:type II CAAX endopeptidase family protein [Aureibacter tunicatorum]MDR6237564.1 hypothetical protein [Aureibacter tunicatorum]BDD02598.1 abortive infection protein [Aureibacter tunicatorum]